MKSKRLFNNIMHFLMHNSFLFTVVIMCLVHATMFGICLISGVRPLMRNTVSRRRDDCSGEEAWVP